MTIAFFRVVRPTQDIPIDVSPNTDTVVYDTEAY
jgi:hypothetical protein